MMVDAASETSMRKPRMNTMAKESARSLTMARKACRCGRDLPDLVERILHFAEGAGGAEEEDADADDRGP